MLGVHRLEILYGFLWSVEIFIWTRLPLINRASKKVVKQSDFFMRTKKYFSHITWILNCITFVGHPKMISVVLWILNCVVDNFWIPNFTISVSVYLSGSSPISSSDFCVWHAGPNKWHLKSYQVLHKFIDENENFYTYMKPSIPRYQAAYIVHSKFIFILFPQIPRHHCNVDIL